MFHFRKKKQGKTLYIIFPSRNIINRFGARKQFCLFLPKTVFHAGIASFKRNKKPE